MSLQDPNERCSNCRYWDPLNGMEDRTRTIGWQEAVRHGAGLCRFDPPSRVWRYAGNTSAVSTQWPITEPGDWCGQMLPLPAEDPEEDQ